MRARPLAALLVLALAALLAACDGADLEPGRDLQVRVPGAQSAVGQLRSGDGPAITLVELRTPTLQPGVDRYLLSGRAVKAATAIHLAVLGDDRYWIVPTALPDPSAPDELGFSLRFAVRADRAPGPLAIRLQAVDAAGRRGPVETAELAVAPAIPEGALVVRLSWDSVADLDLYVVDPTGRRLGPDDPNTYAPPPPGSPPDPPDAWQRGGILDRDAGAGCGIEGPLAEHGIWRQAPPAGAYTVHVDLADPCTSAAVPWQVEVHLDGALIERVGGVLYPEDARATAATGATPARVTRFEVP